MSTGLPHSTAQAHEQGQNPSPVPSDEHPHDLRSRPNDARNEHKAADSGLDNVDYPPQLHAGKVGLGPHYGEQNRVTIGDQIAGIKEDIKGHLTHNHHLVEEGRERYAGELKRKEHEKRNQFEKPGGAAQQADAEQDSKQEQDAPGAARDRKSVV